MIFFLLHHIVHKLPGNLSDQTRNLITFLLGIMLYTFLWTYVNTSKSKNFVVASIRYGFYYIFVSDCFAMGIVYKNYYNRSITTEVSSVWGTNVPVANTKINAEDFINAPISKPESLPLFTNNFNNSSPIIEETTEEIILETPVDLLQEITTELEEEDDDEEENDETEDIDSIENDENAEKTEEVEEVEKVEEVISLPVKKSK